MVSKIEIFYRLIGVGILACIIDAYAIHGLRPFLQNTLGRPLRITFWAFYFTLSGIFIGGLINLGIMDTIRFYREPFDEYYQLVFAAFVLIYLPKLVYVGIVALEDMYRLIVYLHRRYFYSSNQNLRIATAAQDSTLHQGLSVPSQTDNHSATQTSRIIDNPDYWISRKAFIQRSALLVAAMPFAGIIHGISVGRYNFQVHAHDLIFEDLPKSFDGFKVMQLSDIHAGSFTDKGSLNAVIQMINEQAADVILFTGDLVNHRADEMLPYINLFQGLSAPHGIYSTLGNHDYGDYYRWPSEKDKQLNFEDVLGVHQAMDWKMLRNSHALIERESQQLAIVGVENWGKPPFPQYGNLSQAMEGLPATAFSILMSHDPSHWDEEVSQFERHIPLTLSGHTHGMQFGIEIAGISWSPIRYKYPHWAGLYQENNRYLYVNRGFGTVGLPARVGIFPEITVLTLRSGKQQTDVA
jgi:uncharacterized protein